MDLMMYLNASLTVCVQMVRLLFNLYMNRKLYMACTRSKSSHFLGWWKIKASWKFPKGFGRAAMGYDSAVVIGGDEKWEKCSKNADIISSLTQSTGQPNPVNTNVKSSRCVTVDELINTRKYLMQFGSKVNMMVNNPPLVGSSFQLISLSAHLLPDQCHFTDHMRLHWTSRKTRNVITSNVLERL